MGGKQDRRRERDEHRRRGEDRGEERARAGGDTGGDPSAGKNPQGKGPDEITRRREDEQARDEER
ncbi:hypothetical protein [Streptomyces sp. NPDC012888]|uniref:hypothetical protein n=1 Tax=Streptomyces sp. NPDC012888 TaxID=3364855 RepID=UPI003687D05A